ncbi:hypothetical protein SDC9_135620 [bioreactor metagenome]|uniref:Uncharacterized protein n=1 Tax=bioreactor metagenome TaxID=1076179 RepID=A0A645DGP6_9ZZZZ
MHAGGGFFRHAHDLGALAAVPRRVLRQLGLDGGKHDAFFFAGRVGQNGQILLGLLAQVHQHGGVAAVVQNHVRAFAFGVGGAEFKDAVGVIPVVGKRLALDGEHGRAGGCDGRSGVVLRGENIARSPAHVSAQSLQGFDQHGRLNGHVQRAGDARALQRLRLGELFADRHQAGHFGFGDLDFLAAPIGQGNVGNRAVLSLGVHGFLSR